MNSKEALKRLIGNKVFISLGRLQGKKQFVNDINIIEKDLEVLEILKRKSVDIHLIKDIMKDDRKFECYPDENLTQEEFNKIKEWLEND